MSVDYFSNRKSGVSLIGDVPWGTSFCQFYQADTELLEIVVPYLKTGLENNELCVYVATGQGDPEKANGVFEKAIPGYGNFLANRQIDFISPGRLTGPDNFEKIIRSFADRAILSGLDGVRLVCDGAADDSNIVPGFETGIIGRFNAVALFAFKRSNFDTVRLMETVKMYQFALVRNAGKWEVLKSSEVQTIRDALNRSEEKLKSLFSYMSEGFAYHRIVLDGEGKPCDYVFLEANEAFARITGLDRMKIINKRVTQVMPGIDNEGAGWIARYGEVALSGKPVQFDSYSDILEKWFSVSAFSPHRGYFAVTFSDITERKLTEEKLLLSEEKFSKAFANNPAAIALTRLEDGEFIEVNDTWTILSGFSREEAIGHSARRMNIWPDSESAGRFVGELKEKGYLRGREQEFFRKSGEIYVTQLSAQILNMQGGKMILSTMVDITERKRAEGILKRDKETLEKLVREQAGKLVDTQIELERAKHLSDIGVLAATVAHELRNPLAAISMAAYNIKRKADDPGLEKHLINIEKKVGESDQIISNLLFYSRIRPPRYENINMGDILDECTEALEKHGKKTLRIIKKLDAAVRNKFIEADPVQVREIFNNILNNAYDAVPAECGEITIISKMEDERIGIYFEDNGPGIDRDIVDRLFDPFFTTKSKGTGLGLTVCKQIVKMHHGDIGVDGSFTNGTRIFVHLPIKRKNDAIAGVIHH